MNAYDTQPPAAGIQPEPPRRPHRVRKILLITGGAFAALILVIVVIGVAAGHSNSIKPAAAAPAATSPPSPAASSSPAPSPSLTTGTIGSGFEVTGPNGPAGATTVYDVTLDQVDQHASLGQYETLTNGDDHVTGAEFTITGKTGQTTDDADSDAVAVGTDGQDYTASFDTITDGTNFNHGDFNVGPGQAVKGWVAFELPPGVSIASIQWSPGLGGQTATWTVGS